MPPLFGWIDSQMARTQERGQATLPNLLFGVGSCPDSIDPQMARTKSGGKPPFPTCYSASVRVPIRLILKWRAAKSGASPSSCPLICIVSTYATTGRYILANFTNSARASSVVLIGESKSILSLRLSASRSNPSLSMPIIVAVSTPGLPKSSQ